MNCKRVALIFEGTVTNDARVRREIESISTFSVVDVFSTDVRDNDIKYFNNNVNLFQFQLSSSWINNNLLFYNKFSKLKEIFDPFKYDALICIDYPVLKICVEFKTINPKLKVIYDTHEIYIETINQFFPKKGFKSIFGIPLIMVNKWFHYNLEKNLIKKVDVIVTVCDSLKAYFENIIYNEVLVLRNCPDLTSLSFIPVGSNPYIEKYGLNKNDRILLYQGNINEGRGLIQLINTMPLLSTDYKLFIIGSGMLKQKLELLVISLNLQNVFFIDRLPYEELFNYTRYAHLGISLIEPINLSKKLSLPNKLFEYMYCGVPFLSSNLPEPGNLLKFVDAGYICLDFDIQTIKSMILQIFENTDLYKTKSINGKNSVNHTLNWITEFNNLLKQIKDKTN